MSWLWVATVVSPGHKSPHSTKEAPRCSGTARRRLQVKPSCYSPRCITEGTRNNTSGYSQQAGSCMVAESRGGVIVEVSSWLQTIHPHPDPVVVDNMGRVWRKSRVERVVRSSGSQLGGQAEYAYSGAGSERGWTPPAMSSAWVKSYASREISLSYPSFVVRQFAQNWCVMSNHDWEPALMACSKNHCFNTVHEYFDGLLKLWLTI